MSVKLVEFHYDTMYLISYCLHLNVFLLAFKGIK